MDNIETIRYEEPITVGDLKVLRSEEYGYYTLGVGDKVVTGVEFGYGGTVNLELDNGEPWTLSEFLDFCARNDVDDTERLFVNTDTGGWYTLAEAVIEDTAIASYIWLMG